MDALTMVALVMVVAIALLAWFIWVLLQPPINRQQSHTGSLRQPPPPPAKPDTSENRWPFPKPSEVSQPEPEAAAETSTPGTIQELLAMPHLQPCAYGPVAKADQGSGKVQQVLESIAELSTSPLEDQQIALALIGRLERLRQAVVQQFQQDPEANHRSITLWSIDSDRLLHARNMLANVDLG